MDATNTNSTNKNNKDAGIDLTSYPTARNFLTLCHAFLAEVQNLTPGAALEQHLNSSYGPGNPYYDSFCTQIKRGLDEGWVANIPITGPNYRRSKIALPSPESRFFSITTVYMESSPSNREAGSKTGSAEKEEGEGVLRGQYHVHPYGEINCVVQIDETAELRGMGGWRGAGWTSPGPGTHHYPEVRGGALVSLFFLPAGRIAYDMEPGAPQPAVL